MFDYTGFLTKAKFAKFRDELFQKARLLDGKNDTVFTVRTSDIEVFKFTSFAISDNIDRKLVYATASREVNDVREGGYGEIYFWCKKISQGYQTSYDHLGRWLIEDNDEGTVRTLFIQGTGEELVYGLE